MQSLPQNPTSTPRQSLNGFQKTALLTTVMTYALIAVGGVVRASGSGLGCPDWPKCFGGWVPPTSASELPAGFDPALFSVFNTWTEYANRLFGMTVGLLTVATAVMAIVGYRHAPKIMWASIFAMLLTGFEGWLGSVVVKLHLAGWIVSVHLVVALVIVALLLYATVSAFYDEDEQSEAPGVLPVQRTLARRAYVVAGIALAQITLGALVRGGVDDTSAVHKLLSRSEWLESVGWVDIAHREFAIVVFVATVVLTVSIRELRTSAPMLFKIATVVTTLAGAQILVGLILAYAGLPPVAQVIHLTLGSLLLGALNILALMATRLHPTDVDSAT